jgi:hypothetical protein
MVTACLWVALFEVGVVRLVHLELEQLHDSSLPTLSALP